jgi:hypothetical protein
MVSHGGISHRGALASLETVDLSKKPPRGTYAVYFDSPRSLEAFKRSGIQPSELNPVNRENIIN